MVGSQRKHVHGCRRPLKGKRICVDFPYRQMHSPHLHAALQRLAGATQVLPWMWSAPQSSAHREELRVTAARYSAGLRIPSAECGARVL